MSPGLADYVQAVANAASVASITVGYTTNHDAKTKTGTISRHSVGEAVDIDFVNGQTVLALGTARPVKCIQKAARKAYEDFGPAGLWKNGLEFSNQTLQKEHEDHVHIARF